MSTGGYFANADEANEWLSFDAGDEECEAAFCSENDRYAEWERWRRSAEGVTVRKPCRSCPWRVDQDATAIPNFKLELAERLSRTSPDERGYGPEFGAPQFACHQSREGKEIVCAGWLATQGEAHPNVRLQVLRGEVPVEALKPGKGWPALHATFNEVIEKLRRTV